MLIMMMIVMIIDDTHRIELTRWIHWYLKNQSASKLIHDPMTIIGTGMNTHEGTATTGCWCHASCTHEEVSMPLQVWMATASFSCLLCPRPICYFFTPPSLTRLNPLLRARADACTMFQHSKSVEISWLNRLQRHPWRVKFCGTG